MSSPAEADLAPAEGVNNPAEVSDANQTPDSSTGEQGVKTEGSVADAVTAALRTSPGEESPASSRTQGSSEAEGVDPKAKAEGESEEEFSEEELKSLKPKTARAIERFRTKIHGLEQEVTSLAPKAKEFDRLVSFIRQNDLSTDDVNVGFEIMALMKTGRVHEAYDRILPVVQRLQHLVGEVLPPELQERIRLGYISEEDARNLHRARTREQLARTQAERVERRSNEEREQARLQSVVSDVSSAVTAWEQAKKQADPEWHLKAPRIDQMVRLAVYEKGYPQTREAAVKMVEEIYATVSKELRKFVPAPQEKRPVNGASSSQAVAEPTSLLEAIRIGMNR